MGRVTVWDFLYFTTVAAILFSLVRPNSKAGAAMVVAADAVAGTIGWATGYAQTGG
jgi:hypothetical protein